MSSVIDTDLPHGTRVGRYEIRRLLGRGGFGSVYAARDVELDRDVALKFLLPQHTHNREVMQRFFLEARAAARIDHPAIVTIHEVGHVQGSGSPFDGGAFIAMEMVRGESLARRLARVGRLDFESIIELGKQIASALAVAHAAGIVHRDLKPDNLMLARDPSHAEASASRSSISGSQSSSRVHTRAVPRPGAEPSGPRSTCRPSNIGQLRTLMLVRMSTHSVASCSSSPQDALPSRVTLLIC